MTEPAISLVRGVHAASVQSTFGLVRPAANEEWYTPKPIFDALGLYFDLDVASPLDGPLSWIPAGRHFTRREDGLVQPWSGSVWMNPPYGAGVGQWMSKLRAHGNGIALVNARTEAAWFQESIFSASAVVFVAGRIRFVNREHLEAGCKRPRMASALFGFGLQAAKALHLCGLGWVAK